MSRFIICGINGKVGKLLCEKAIEKDHQIVCGVDLKTSGLADCPVYSDFDQVKDFADAIIDFSSPSALKGLLAYAVENKTPVVLCATGYNKNDLEIINSVSYQIPIFKSSNTSLALNLVVKLCETAVKFLNGFDIEIIEKHHADKKDSPSGTAKTIFNALAFAKQNATEINGRKGNAKRKANEIGVHSIRGGGIVGEHSVSFLSKDESVTITHTALNKELFADGALKAGEFIINKPTGLYGMDDLLNFCLKL